MKLGDQSDRGCIGYSLFGYRLVYFLLFFCAFYDFIYRRTEEYLPTTTAEFADAWMACGKRDGNSIQKYETLNRVYLLCASRVLLPQNIIM